ncbi:MAG: winged helix-turn-helix transcriptional regulator [Rhodothalassiaceae bacterium]
MDDDRDSDHLVPAGCALDRVFRLLSGEWTLHILWVLGRFGPTRFGQLRRQVAGISAKVLTDRLRLLEREGVIWRDAADTASPQVRYGLTARGQELDQALVAMERAARSWH